MTEHALRIITWFPLIPGKPSAAEIKDGYHSGRVSNSSPPKYLKDTWGYLLERKTQNDLKDLLKTMVRRLSSAWACRHDMILRELRIADNLETADVASLCGVSSPTAASR
jgi:hypothetical protein